MHPATLTFDHQQRKIAIVNNVPEKASKELTPYKEDPEEEYLKLGYITSHAQGDTRIASEILAEQIAEQNYFDTIVICDSALRASDKIPRHKRLSPKEVNKLASELNVDLIVAIENLQLEAKQSAISYDLEYDCFHGVTEIKACPTFSIYTPHSDVPIKTQTLCDSIYLEGYDYTIAGTSMQMPTDKEILYEGTLLAGTIPVKYIVPTWETESRYFYAGGNTQMRDAAIYVRENSWNKAYELWKSIYEKTKKQKRKMQSAFNIALYYEMKDNITEAINWASKAQEISRQIDKVDEKKEVDLHDIRHYYLATQYLDKLNIRQEMLSKLNQQMERFKQDF